METQSRAVSGRPWVNVDRLLMERERLLMGRGRLDGLNGVKWAVFRRFRCKVDGPYYELKMKTQRNKVNERQ